MGMTQHFHTIPTSCAILPLPTQICFVCLLVVCRRLWKVVWWVVLGVHVDVHGECVMLWMAAMYNVLAILSIADMVCRYVCRNCGVHEQCWVCMVCMVRIWSVWYVQGRRESRGGPGKSFHACEARKNFQLINFILRGQLD